MWHHSGPYDAVAGSRNDARERGVGRAPMMVFDPMAPYGQGQGEGQGYGQSHGIVVGGGPGSAGSGGKRRGSQDRGKKGSTSPSSATGEDYVPVLSSSQVTQSAGIKPRATRHASSPGIFGSLQEEYSQSMPASGGYMAARGAGAGSRTGEEDSERRIREREREQKRRALQAAWGTDERE